MIIIPALVKTVKSKTIAEFPVFVILCFVATLILKIGNSNAIISTIYGKIEGFHHTTPSGFKTEIFLGIPYAAPPVRSLKFEKPLPPTPWTSTLQAKAFGPACATLPKFSPPTASEDCLFMNIIKPATPSPNTNGYPIMLWIHGGGFLVGSSENYPFEETAERIVKNGVIFISIIFRQGAFGFFSDVDSDAAGNNGLWDQIQALKFIQKNAKGFDGNPKNVTLFGQSSGAIAVSLLSLSPKTENLFQRTILMSGSSNQRLELQPTNSSVSLHCILTTYFCKKITKELKHLETSMSPKTKLMNKQVHRTLIIQAIGPFITCQIILTLAFPKIENNNITVICSIFFAYIPILNPFAAMIIISTYRKRIMLWFYNKYQENSLG
uniref:Carboxylesterase type B domain-containing protein n=1 Tax=Panagrolaimus sp. PS1159 TaxID=55785 RepID=A0AC35F4U4_9BILA